MATADVAQVPRIVVMGVSGSGKTTLASALAQALHVPFAEGDDFHPEANRQKMAAGVPLTDEDRWPWLRRLRDWASEHPTGCVMACSALRRTYRDVLREAGDAVVFIEVDAPADRLRRRMETRPGHYMPPSLLTSQLETLEPLGPDERGVRIDGALAPDAVLDEARAAVRSLVGQPVTDQRH